MNKFQPGQWFIVFYDQQHVLLSGYFNPSYYFLPAQYNLQDFTPKLLGYDIPKLVHGYHPHNYNLVVGDNYLGFGKLLRFVLLVVMQLT